jgi:hypothetical protein
VEKLKRAAQGSWKDEGKLRVDRDTTVCSVLYLSVHENNVFIIHFEAFFKRVCVCENVWKYYFF